MKPRIQCVVKARFHGVGSNVELVQVLVDVGGEPADQPGKVALVLG